MAPKESPPETPEPERPQFDLNDVLNNTFDITAFKVDRTEKQDERAARLFKEKTSHLVNICKDSILFLFSIAVCAIAIWFCITILRDVASSPDDKKWAQTFFALIGSAVISYLVGKKG